MGPCFIANVMWVLSLSDQWWPRYCRRNCLQELLCQRQRTLVHYDRELDKEGNAVDYRVISYVEDIR